MKDKFESLLKNRKFIAVVSIGLACIIGVSIFVCAGDTPNDKPKHENKMIIGNATELGGEFGASAWINGAADVDIRTLTYGYETVAQTQAGEFVYETKNVLESVPTITKNTDGSQTYQMKIQQGLTYSDGTKITAKDYVVYLVAMSTPVVAFGSYSGTAGGELLGFDEFHNYNGTNAGQEGVSKEFSGVRLLGEYELSVTVSSDFLPYYYAILYAQLTPYPVKLWLGEGADIQDDGNGCYISGNWYEKDGKGAYKKQAYYTSKTGPRFATNTRPVSGPYKIQSYDEAQKVATLTINDKYVGNFEGQQPSIQTVVYKKIVTATQIADFTSGNVDVLQQLAEGSEINAALAEVKKSNGKYDYTTYLRSGYGKLDFVCDFGPTQFLEVRHSVAHLLDRVEFANTFTGGYGSIVHGPYGLSFWGYQELKEEFDDSLNTYDYSLSEATAALIKGGWIYGVDGKAYKSGVRYKKLETPTQSDKEFTVSLDGTEYKTVKVGNDYYMPLVLNWAALTQNPVTDLLKVMLEQNKDVASAGIKIKCDIMDFSTLQKYLERDTSMGEQYGIPTYNMFNLAIGFAAVYDQSGYYSTADHPTMGKYYQKYNTNKIQDKTLSDACNDMVYKAETREDFKGYFQTFIEKWNELLPSIPLYSNNYHTVYNAKIQGVKGKLNPDWSIVNQLVYCSIQ